jgi:hypothetical protein
MPATFSGTEQEPQEMTTPLAYQIEAASDAAGVSRTRIFEAIRNKELTARKAGRTTIIEAGELQRWIRSLPTRGTRGDSTTTSAAEAVA